MDLCAVRGAPLDTRPHGRAVAESVEFHVGDFLAFAQAIESSARSDNVWTASRAGDVELLTDDMSGGFIVLTDDGCEFRVDLDERVIRMTRGDASGPFARGGGEDIDLLELAMCRLGEPMVLLIDLKVPGVWFTRRTTEPVHRILRLSCGPLKA